MESEKSKSSLKDLLVKSVVILGLIYFFIKMALPDFRSIGKSIEHSLSKPKNQIILLSLIDNPVALLKMAEIDIQEKKYDKAILQIELAIGLAEMHGGNKEFILELRDKLNEAKSHEYSSRK